MPSTSRPRSLIHVELAYVGSTDYGLTEFYEMRFVDEDGNAAATLAVYPDHSMALAGDSEED